jgi:hypothetical protein
MKAISILERIMRRFALLLILFILVLPSLAQDSTSTPYEIALQRIEEARVSGTIYLFLNQLDLEELPPELFNLTNLHELH